MKENEFSEATTIVSTDKIRVIKDPATVPVSSLASPLLLPISTAVQTELTRIDAKTVLPARVAFASPSFVGLPAPFFITEDLALTYLTSLVPTQALPCELISKCPPASQTSQNRATLEAAGIFIERMNDSYSHQRYVNKAGSPSYATINLALAACVPGDEVKVGIGTYAESIPVTDGVTIDCDTNVIITGDGIHPTVYDDENHTGSMIITGNPTIIGSILAEISLDAIHTTQSTTDLYADATAIGGLCKQDGIIPGIGAYCSGGKQTVTNAIGGENYGMDSIAGTGAYCTGNGIQIIINATGGIDRGVEGSGIGAVCEGGNQTVSNAKGGDHDTGGGGHGVYCISGTQNLISTVIGTFEEMAIVKAGGTVNIANGCILTAGGPYSIQALTPQNVNVTGTAYANKPTSSEITIIGGTLVIQ